MFTQLFQFLDAVSDFFKQYNNEPTQPLKHTEALNNSAFFEGNKEKNVWESTSLLLIGCGNIGQPLLEKLLEAGTPSEKITVVTKSGNLPKCFSGTKVKAYSTESIKKSSVAKEDFSKDIVIYAAKPQEAGDILALYKDAQLIAPHSLIISMAAGLQTKFFKAYFPESTVMRCFPNLAIRVGASINAGFMEKEASDKKPLIEKLLSNTGNLLWMENEQQMDLVATISKLGLVFYLIKCMANTGTMLGLSKREAEQLAVKAIQSGLQRKEFQKDSIDTSIEYVLNHAHSSMSTIIRQATFAAIEATGYSSNNVSSSVIKQCQIRLASLFIPVIEEAWSRKGIEEKLPPAFTETVVTETLKGGVALAAHEFAKGRSPEDILTAITSAHGVNAHFIYELEKPKLGIIGIANIVQHAMDAAKYRSFQLKNSDYSNADNALLTILKKVDPLAQKEDLVLLSSEKKKESFHFVLSSKSVGLEWAIAEQLNQLFGREVEVKATIRSQKLNTSTWNKRVAVNITGDPKHIMESITALSNGEKDLQKAADKIARTVMREAAPAEKVLS